MAQLAAQADGGGPTSSVTPADTTDLTLAARTPGTDQGAHSVWLEWKPSGATSWMRVTGSLLDLAATPSAVASVALPDGAEVRAHPRGGGADIYLEGSNYT